MTKQPVLIRADEAIAEQARGGRLIDATWFMPNAGVTGAQTFARQRLPGAVFFDIDAVSDPTTTLPHMVPGAATLSRWMAQSGLQRTDPLIVYDQNGLMASARAWWTLRRFGLDVRLLDGGLVAWAAAGGAVETHAPGTPAGASPPGLTMIRDDAMSWADVRHHMLTGDAVIVDARPAGRFAGTDPEPRPGLPSGHIPGSLSLPFKTLLDAQGHSLRGSALDKALPVSDRTRRIICTCGSGVTAAVLHAAFTQAGFDDVWLYDGSWTEWAGRGDLPIETTA